MQPINIKNIYIYSLKQKEEGNEKLSGKVVNNENKGGSKVRKSGEDGKEKV